MSMKVFAETLKRLMHERNVSAKVLAQATGIAPSSLSEYLSGSRAPVLGEPVLKLARFFGVSVEYLICGKHPEETLIQTFLDDLPEEFTTIHRGVYRISVERYAGPAKKRAVMSKEESHEE